MTQGRMVKVSVNLPAGTVQLLREMAEDQGTTMTQVIRTAIRTERLLRSTVRSGGRILIEEPDGKMRQMVFTAAGE